MLTGPFVADLAPEILAASGTGGVLEVVYVRSPYAAARITSVDATAATAAPGVVAVFTAADLPILPLWEIALIPEQYAQPALADGEVRYVGERVAAVVATTYAAALDAAEQVVVGYEPLDPVTDPAAGATCLDWPSHPRPDGDGGDDSGAVSVTVDVRMPRVCVAPLEGHAVLAVPADDGTLTVWASTQVPVAAHRQLCRSLALAPSQVRVVAPAVGGGFGGKAAGAVADHMVAAAAARALRRPVRFVEDRRANLMTMQGRGVSGTVSLHATAAGELTGVSARIVADAGAYPNVGAVEPGKTRMMMCGPYRVRHADVDARAVVTNLAPVGAYRGPGRSEASLLLERAVDTLAAELGMDPLELRRRNVLQPSEFPYAAPTGVEYDSGNYPRLLARLAEVAGYDELRRAQARGGRFGVGLAMVVDSTAWFSRVESAGVRVEPDGTLVVRAGTASAGQRHDAMYRAVVRSVIAVRPEDIRVIEGDTRAWDASDGTMGSRTAQMGGGAVLGAVRTVDGQLRDLAARELEAGAEDIVFHDGAGYGVRGVPSRALGLAELVARARETVEASCTYEQPGAAYPAAAHLSVVEVDPETGAVVPVRHVAVTDCGRVLDEASARGQVIGATVQGIAQALYEHVVFDGDGTPCNASFADYGIPGAADVPPIEVHFLETPTPRNPLGAKGVGEIGMLAAPAAVLNAVVDALRPFGVRHIDMPCTPEAVWTTLRR